MKTTLTILLLTTGMHACHDTPLSSHQPTDKTERKIATATRAETALFEKNKGVRIDSATGDRWIENFARVNDAEAHHTLNVNALIMLLTHTGCVGISFYYATDDADNLRIIPVGTATNGSMLHGVQSETTRGEVNWTTAREMIDNYTGSVRYHFFGIASFQRLLTRDCKNVRISLAMDDANGLQLLLSDAGDPTPGNYESAGTMCPPHCGSD